MDDRVELEARRIYESVKAFTKPWADLEGPIRDVWRDEARVQLAKGANDE